MAETNKLKKILIYAAATLAVFASFMLGASAAERYMDPAAGYDSIGSREDIGIYASESYDEKIAAAYLEDLERLPEALTAECSRIIFTDEDLNEKFDTGITARIVAITVGRNIYISTDYHDMAVLVHEMLHVLDYANGWLTETEEFEEIYEEYKDEHEVSPGNAQNAYEFFASYGEKFFLDADGLERDSLFAYFEDLNIK